MTDEPNPEEKKIVVDEDWKSQVQAEKEAAQRAEESQPAASAEAPAPLPPPTLTVLAGSLYLQGFVLLGMLPVPGSDKPEVSLPQAKNTIDMLQMLEDKTQGNRTPDETHEIETMLHELRLAYVGMQGRAEDTK